MPHCLPGGGRKHGASRDIDETESGFYSVGSCMREDYCVLWYPFKGQICAYSYERGFLSIPKVFKSMFLIPRFKKKGSNLCL